jgi:pantoate kinase
MDRQLAMHQERRTDEQQQGRRIQHAIPIGYGYAMENRSALARYPFTR